GVYITQANEPAAGQDVFHLHFHVYPRWHKIPQQITRVDDTARTALYERLKNVLP
ncbi:MAG: HIT domain-containing protein, partial [Anaerolineae bacterium]|nr:HIT domain-containing protein [Anaerolineae bacterium]